MFHFIWGEVERPPGNLTKSVFLKIFPFFSDFLLLQASECLYSCPFSFGKLTSLQMELEFEQKHMEKIRVVLLVP